jgi:hypothetical protein
MDEVFDLEQAGAALFAPRDQPLRLPYPVVRKPVFQRQRHQWALSSSTGLSARESEPVEWVKALLNKLCDNRWSVVEY